MAAETVHCRVNQEGVNMATTVRSTTPDKPREEEGGLSTECKRSLDHDPD